MKVCFVGIGSIARRHIKNIRELKEDIVIDAIHHVNTGNEDYDSEIDRHYYSYEEAPNDYDVIFITNPTSMHFEALERMHEKGKHFFIEKPVFMTGKENFEHIKLRNDSVYYVACPLRYSNVLQYVKNNIDFSSIFSVRCICSSYLPEWRKGSDYRCSYSAHTDNGGGVDIDLIHEWDYIVWLLGQPRYVKSLISRKSKLEIDSSDIAVYIAEYDKQIVELHLDYFGRHSIRKMELLGKDDTIEVDLLEQRISWLKSGNVIDLYQERNDYQKRELQHFLDIIDGKCTNDSSISEAFKVLRIAKGM